MKKIYQHTKILISAAAISALISGCSLFGLDVQKDYDRTPKTLDPKIYKTTWEFIKEKGASPTNNNGLSRMLEAIIYSEIDTLEYTKPGRTFILFTNASIFNTSATNTTVFFNNVRINNARATAWSSYSKEFVRNYLKYLIVEGIHDHYTIQANEVVTAKTLAPAGYFNMLPAGYTMLNFLPDNNPESEMLLRVINSSPSNTSDYPLQVNNTVNMRTSSIQASNGSIHVSGAYLTPMLPL